MSEAIAILKKEKIEQGFPRREAGSISKKQKASAR